MGNLRIFFIPYLSFQNVETMKIKDPLTYIYSKSGIIRITYQNMREYIQRVWVYHSKKKLHSKVVHPVYIPIYY